MLQPSPNDDVNAKEPLRLTLSCQRPRKKSSDRADRKRVQHQNKRGVHDDFRIKPGKHFLDVLMSLDMTCSVVMNVLRGRHVKIHAEQALVY